MKRRRLKKRVHRTLMLRVSCPNCFSQPAVKVFSEQVEKYRGEDPDKPIINVKCMHCKTIYNVTARAFQQAS